MIKIEAVDDHCKARVGTMVLPHGEVQIPNFMPVGTNASVKGILHDDLKKMGIKLILANTYHLFLRPGIDVIKKAGGLHGFSNWEYNFLTDSGGFQVFSLASFRKITSEGIKFRSHIDGSYHFLSPQLVVDLQMGFNSDIMMPLDVCTGPEVSRKEAENAVHTTHNWLAVTQKYLNDNRNEYKGKLFGIIQGNFHKDLRKQSLEKIHEINTDGIAIGGLSVGEPFNQFEDFVSFIAAQLNFDKPHYVMGIGTPEYILSAVENGIDIFDCVYPTRIARNGSAMTPFGILDLVKQKNEFLREPIQNNCECVACKSYSRDYLRHLFKAGEMLGPMLVTQHNLFFLNNFMQQVRDSIRNNTFLIFKNKFLNLYKGKHKVVLP